MIDASFLRSRKGTNPSLIPRKPTGIGRQYFLYREVTNP
jgi:hypothetical protein